MSPRLGVKSAGIGEHLRVVEFDGEALTAKWGDRGCGCSSYEGSREKKSSVDVDCVRREEMPSGVMLYVWL